MCYRALPLKGMMLPQVDCDPEGQFLLCLLTSWALAGQVS